MLTLCRNRHIIDPSACDELLSVIAQADTHGFIRQICGVMDTHLVQYVAARVPLAIDGSRVRIGSHTTFIDAMKMLAPVEAADNDSLTS